jgi:hypothetical protein
MVLPVLPANSTTLQDVRNRLPYAGEAKDRSNLIGH